MSSGGTEQESGEHPWAMMGRRLTRPARQHTFYAVLIIGVLILGYLAVWIEIAGVWNFDPTTEMPEPDLEPLRLAYATAILAVAAPSVMQLGLTLNKMAVVTGFVLLLFFLSLAYWVSEAEVSQCGVHLLGLAGLAVATLSWWLANGEDELFQDRANPNAASGGDPERDLNGGNSGVKL